MKELSNKEIKQISLRILLDIHKFCVSHNIQYSLAYGTLIGAIRHKGFIPWDDDIDIMMPREDYEKFFRTFSEKGYITTSPIQGNSYLFFGRVYDTIESIAKPARPQGTEDDIGVWIDVFPIDNVPTNQNEYNKETNRFLKLFRTVYNIRFSMISIKELGISPANIYAYLKGKLLGCFYKVNKIITAYDNRIKLLSKTGEYKGWLSDHVYIGKEYLPADIFKDYKSVTFEDREFFIIEKYDAFLKNFYGDYMQMPPIDKRIPPHSFHKFYKK